MKYLLDTQTAIWTLGYKAKLSESAKVIIDDVSLPLCVSIISAWEIAIKVSIGKLNFDGGSAAFLNKMQHNSVELIDVTCSHIKHVENLPFIHRDPFDRMLVATAMAEGMTILTPDGNIQKYNVLWIW